MARLKTIHKQLYFCTNEECGRGFRVDPKKRDKRGFCWWCALGRKPLSRRVGGVVPKVVASE
jgi:hypothetical protein